MSGPRLHTPSLPWLSPRTESIYVCQSGAVHPISDPCTCTTRSP